MPFDTMKRLTRFPGVDETSTTPKPFSTTLDDKQEHESSSVEPGDRRRTKFPGLPDNRLQLLNETRLPTPIQSAENINPSHLPPRLPLIVHGQSTASSGTSIHYDDPSLHYDTLRGIDMNNRVKLARKLSLPTFVVTLKELRQLLPIAKILNCQHKNLQRCFEIYEFHGKKTIVSEYAQVSLRQIIAIPLRLEEIHVSNMCSQIYRGMQYLATQDYSFDTLDTSNILLESDGCVKIAWIGHCQKMGLGTARVLGLLALSMMQKGVVPDYEPNEKLALRAPELWSAEIANFVEICSFCALDQLKQNKLLAPSTSLVLIPFISYVQLEAVAPRFNHDQIDY